MCGFRPPPLSLLVEEAAGHRAKSAVHKGAAVGVAVAVTVAMGLVVVVFVVMMVMMLLVVLTVVLFVLVVAFLHIIFRQRPRDCATYSS